MILITGGTGFVGSHLVRYLEQQGVRLRILVRNPELVQAFASQGVEAVIGDVTNRSSLEAAVSGVERIIHLVGIIQQAPGVTFAGIHVQGTRNLLQAAKKGSVRQFLFLSALGSRSGARSSYHQTKWEAEQLVSASGIPYTILRPSLIYGPGDKFTLRMAQMLRFAPFLPVLGSGQSRLQPIYIDDLVACVGKAVRNDSFLNRIYEIGGPARLSYEEVTRAIAQALGIKRPLIHLPLLFMRPLARLLETLLRNPPVTTEQLIMLQEDNVCDMEDIRDTFGIDPLGFQVGLRKFF